MAHKYYYKDGTISDSLSLDRILHRLDGPAIIYSASHCSYYIDDIKISKDDFDRHSAVVAYRTDRAIRDILSE